MHVDRVRGGEKERRGERSERTENWGGSVTERERKRGGGRGDRELTFFRDW